MNEQWAEAVRVLQQSVEAFQESMKRIVEVLQSVSEGIIEAQKPLREHDGQRLIDAADIAEISERVARAQRGGEQ